MPDVLIVDDNEDAREILSMILRADNFASRQAEDGFQALAMIAEKRPDLILLDYMMPGMSGIQLVERLQQSVESSPIPIIIISAAGHYNRELAAVGVEKVIPKGQFSANELRRMVKSVLKKHKVTE